MSIVKEMRERQTVAVSSSSSGLGSILLIGCAAFAIGVLAIAGWKMWPGGRSAVPAISLGNQPGALPQAAASPAPKFSGTAVGRSRPGPAAGGLRQGRQFRRLRQRQPASRLCHAEHDGHGNAHRLDGRRGRRQQLTARRLLAPHRGMRLSAEQLEFVRAEQSRDRSRVGLGIHSRRRRRRGRSSPRSRARRPRCATMPSRASVCSTRCARGYVAAT